MIYMFGRNKKDMVRKEVRDEDVMDKKTGKQFNYIYIDICDVTPNGDLLEIANVKVRLQTDEQRRPFFLYNGRRVYVNPDELRLRADGSKRCLVIRESPGILRPYASVLLKKPSDVDKLGLPKEQAKELKERIAAFTPMTVNEKTIFIDTWKRLQRHRGFWDQHAGLVIGGIIFVIAMVMSYMFFKEGAASIGLSMKDSARIFVEGLKGYLNNTLVPSQHVPVG